MATAGPNSPAAGADDTSTGSGTTAWTNPGNITAQDSTYATANGAQTTHWLKATNFGFSIPAGATINGVTLSIVEGGYSQSAGSASFWYAFLWNGGQIGSGVSESFGTSLGATTLTMGSASNLWGATLDTTVTNASTFGVEIRIDAHAGSTITTSNIDCLQLTITYTLASGGPHITQTRQAVMRAATR